jgi:hypothetical protein
MRGSTTDHHCLAVGDSVRRTLKTNDVAAPIVARKMKKKKKKKDEVSRSARRRC